MFFTRKILVIVAILSFAFINQTKAQTKTIDTIALRKVVKDEIHLYSGDFNGGVWVIAGDNWDKIYHINAKYKLKKVKAKLPTDVSFTDILCISKQLILLGTTNKYTYYIKRKKAIQLNEKSGIQDSITNLLSWNGETRQVSVRTPSGSFISTDRTYTKYTKYKETEDSGSMSFNHIFKDYLQQPVQKAICEVVSEVDYSFREEKLIKTKDVRIVKKMLYPGDIIIKRNDSQVTNWGIAGYWTHAGIYIGGKTELNNYFSGLKMLNGEKPSEYIKKHHRKVYGRLIFRHHMIIEAIGEGVLVNKLDHIVRVDHLAVFRTNLEKEDLFKAIIKSFEYYKRPYDYLFDLKSDDAVVCSELVYKSFITNSNKQGLSFEPGTLNGSSFFSPSDIGKLFCKEYGSTANELKMILFYNIDDKTKSVKQFLEDDFCKTIVH